MMKSVTVQRPDGQGHLTKYAVNSEGEGLFSASADTGWAYRQWLGTSQFRADSYRQFRRKLARFVPGVRVVSRCGWD